MLQLLMPQGFVCVKIRKSITGRTIVSISKPPEWKWKRAQLKSVKGLIRRKKAMLLEEISEIENAELIGENTVFGEKSKMGFIVERLIRSNVSIPGKGKLLFISDAAHKDLGYYAFHGNLMPSKLPLNERKEKPVA